jgi:hypothetical protein
MERSATCSVGDLLAERCGDDGASARDPAAGHRCTAAAFGSSLKVKWGHTSRFPNQEIRVAQRPAELKMRPGHRLRSFGNVTRTNDVPILRAVAERLSGVPLLGGQLEPTLP